MWTRSQCGKLIQVRYSSSSSHSEASSEDHQPSLVHLEDDCHTDQEAIHNDVLPDQSKPAPTALLKLRHLSFHHLTPVQQVRIHPILRHLNINEKDLDREGIDWDTFEEAVHPSLYGGVINFLMLGSLSRIFLRSLVFRRSAINRGTPKILDLVVNPTSTSDLKTDEEGLYVPKETASSMKESSSLLDPTRKQKTCGLPLVTSSSILFESKGVLRQVYAVNAFHETVEILVEGVWSAFLTSLLVNGLVNFYLYPEEREGMTLLNVLGLSALLNILCVEQIPFLHEYFCFQTDAQYEEILASSLDQIYVWPVLIGAPLVLGLLNGIREAFHAKRNTHVTVEHVTEKLECHEPGIWKDVVGWIFSSVLPDLLSAIVPPTILFSLLPQPKLKHALEKIQKAILWDGRLSAKDRRKLFDVLLIFSRTSHKITKAKSLATLAELVDGISFNGLSIMKAEGTDAEVLRGLLFIKTTSLAELQRLAKKFKSRKGKYNISSLPRYIYANYLLWSLGYPEHFFLQPLFFSYKLVKLYFTLMFYKAIIGGLIGVLNRHLEKQDCLSEGKKWLFYPQSEEYLCSACGDLPIFFRDIFTMEECLQGYLGKPRTLKEISKFADSYDLSSVTVLDMSHQKILNDTDFISFVKEFQGKMPGLKKLVGAVGMFGSYRPTDPCLTALAEFVPGTALEELTLSGWFVRNEESFIKLFNALKELPTKALALDEMVLGFDFTPTSLSILENSNITKFEVKWREFNGIENFLEMLPRLKISELRLEGLDGRFTIKHCLLLASKLPQTKISVLSLKHNYFAEVEGENCVTALLRAISNSTLPEFHFELSEYIEIGNGPGPNGFPMGINVGDSGISNLAKILAANPNAPLTSLSIGTTNLTTSTFLEFIEVLPHSNLRGLFLDIYPVTPWYPKPVPVFPKINYTVAVPRLVDALHRSEIEKFRFWGTGTMGDEGARLIAEALPEKLGHLIHLDLPGNGISNSGFSALAKSLPRTNIEFFGFRYNLVGESFVDLEVEKTALTAIDGSMNLIPGNVLTNFTKKIDQSKMKEIHLCCQCQYQRLPCIKTMLNSDVIENIRDSPVKILDARGFSVTDEEAQKMAYLLQTHPPQHTLWIDMLRRHVGGSTEPATNLTQFRIANRDGDMRGGIFSNASLQALCNALPQTDIDISLFVFDMEYGFTKRVTEHGFAKNAIATGLGYGPEFNRTILENCGLPVSASPGSLTPPYPLLLVAQGLVLTKSTGKAIVDSLWRSNPRALLQGAPRPACAFDTKFPHGPSERTSLVADSACYSESFEGYSEFYLASNLEILCATFLTSVNHSILLLSVPKFVSEVLFTVGGLSRDAALAAGQDMQLLLTLSLTHSTTALTAGFLAQWITARFTKSPKFSSFMNACASISVSLLESAWTQGSLAPVSAIGVALLGAKVGSVIVESASNVGHKVFGWFRRRK